MSSLDIEAEREAVEKTIKKWYKAATDMDLDSFMELAADDFVLLNPEREAIKGKDGFRDFFYEYGGGSYGPVSLGESWIDVSESGDLAYHHGTHHHVILEDGVESRVSTWKQLIVLKKLDGKWKFAAMSETSLSLDE
jgi:uncharacterized protein (TIGR02246 family)